MPEWQRFDVHGVEQEVESENADGDPLVLRVYGAPLGSAYRWKWKFELIKKDGTIHRATTFDKPGIDDALQAALRWSWDAKKNFNGWRGGWNTWHLQLENDNDRSYHEDYMDLVREYNDALADNPDFNQESIREALSRHLLQIITHSDADYVLHHIDFDELWETFLNNAKEEREYDDKR